MKKNYKTTTQSLVKYWEVLQNLSKPLKELREKTDTNTVMIAQMAKKILELSDEVEKLTR